MNHHVTYTPTNLCFQSVAPVCSEINECQGDTLLLAIHAPPCLMLLYNFHLFTILMPFVWSYPLQLFYLQGFESNNLTFLLLCISNHLHLVQSLWGLWLWRWLKRKHVLLSPCCSVTKSLVPFHSPLIRGGQLIYPRGHVRNWAPWVN